MRISVRLPIWAASWLLLLGAAPARACSCGQPAGWLRAAVRHAPRLVLARVGGWRRRGHEDALEFRIAYTLKGPRRPDRVWFRRPVGSRSSCDPEYEPGTTILLEMAGRAEGAFGCAATGNLSAFLGAFDAILGWLPHPGRPARLTRSDLQWVLARTVGPFLSGPQAVVVSPGTSGAPFRVEDSTVRIVGAAPEDAPRIEMALRHGGLRFVRGRFDGAGVEFAIAYVQARKGREELATALTPWGVTPPRYRCAAAADCVVTCAHGALNKTWYEGHRGRLARCDGGCAEAAAPDCLGQRCVTVRGPKREWVSRCTERPVVWRPPDR